MSKIRQAAKGQPCSLRLAGCMHSSDTVVLCHLPSVDHGMGLKSPDWNGVFGCANCHDILDGRKGGGIMRVEILERMLAGLYESQREMIRLGLIEIHD